MAESHVSPGESRDHNERGQNEADARDKQARKPGTLVTDVNGEFARAGARNQIAGAEQIEEFFAREPLASPDEFVLHDGNVRSGTTEGREPQTKKKCRQLAQRSGAGMLIRGSDRCPCGIFRHVCGLSPMMRRDGRRGTTGPRRQSEGTAAPSTWSSPYGLPLRQATSP